MKLKIMIAVLAAGLSTTAHAATNLVQNGDFSNIVPLDPNDPQSQYEATGWNAIPWQQWGGGLRAVIS